MNPYYKDGAVTIYHGDCRQILSDINKVEFSFTDPPYNVGKKYGSHNDNMPLWKYFAWVKSWLNLVVDKSENFAIYPPKNHLRWFMNRLPEHHLVVASWFPYGAIRGGYVHQYAPLLLPKTPKHRVQDHWAGCKMPGCGYFFTETTYGHPGYTSEHLTKTVLSCCTDEGDTVLDPFGGTGTTGRAAKDLGRKAVLIEIEERYCEIAARRMGQEVLL